MSLHAEVKAKLSHQQSQSAKRVLNLLESESLVSDGMESTSTTASEAFRLWKTRLRNTGITHKAIRGLPELVERLESISPNKKVEYFGFTGRGLTVTVILEKTSGTLVGAVSVDDRA